MSDPNNPIVSALKEIIQNDGNVLNISAQQTSNGFQRIVFDRVNRLITRMLSENISFKQKLMQFHMTLNLFEEFIVWAKTFAKRDISNEISHRQERDRNLIMYNLSEEVHNSSIIFSDHERIKSIFNIMKVNVDVIKFIRLGERSERCRPIKLFMSDTSIVFHILQVQTALESSLEFNGIRFAEDCTRRQRLVRSWIKNEEQSRRQNNDTAADMSP